MAPSRKEYELSVEQELPASADGAPRRARLTARFSTGSGEAELDDAELARSLKELADRLVEATETAGVGRGPGSEHRPDRPLTELLETYRPRQIELVELLYADGELTEGEYDVLRRQVTGRPSEPEAARAPVPPTPPPVRAGGRSVEDLLRTYQITSLRQAGAVRARRQITFEEYMSLKRHFAESETSPPSATTPG